MKLPSIQVLRGLAALLVVLYHARTLELSGIAAAGSPDASLVNGLFASGFAGVDLFFVISGFIMVWVTEDARSGPAASADFLFARFTRIYPVWWVAAALGLVYAVLSGEMLLSDVQSGLKTPGGNAEADHVLKSFLLLPQPEFPVLLIGWTLIHEVYFYAVFALILLLPRRFMTWALLVWGIAIAGASLAGLPLHIAKDFLSLAVHPMTMEFIFGAGVGLIVTSGLVWRAGLVTLVSTLWLVAAIGLQGVPDEYTLLWGRVLEIGLPCAGLVYGIAGLNVQDRLAWLIPAGIGALIAAFVFQSFGTVPETPFATRRDAAILGVTVGAVAMGIVFWFGYLLGQTRPGVLFATAPFWRALHGIAARIGDWSYSIYLFHLFALGILQRLMGRVSADNPLAPYLRLGAPGVLDNLVFAIGALLTSIAAGWIGYQLIERPSGQLFGWLRRKLFRRAA